MVNILISDLTHVWSQDQGSTKYIFMFTRRTKFIIYFYMCVRVIVSCNNQIFFHRQYSVKYVSLPRKYGIDGRHEAKFVQR